MLNEIFLFEQSTSWLEIIAMITGLIGVWLTMKQNIWCFPVGIINVSLYAWLFLTPGIRLYADALLQIIYVFLLLYGWLYWSQRKNNIVPVKTVKIKFNTALKLLLLCILSTISLAVFLSEFTEASLPWLDSALTCASLAAQWMIARKIIENWLIWIAVNIAYIPMYLIKHLPLTAILYSIFLILAFKGFVEWKKSLHES